MNDHTRMRQNLSPYLDGAVTQEERREIEEHLEACPACRQALDELRKTVAHLHELPAAEPPPWLAAQIMTRVREAAQQKRSIWQRLFFPLQVKLPLEAVALFVICVTGYYLAHNLLSSPELQISRPVTEPQQHPPAPSPSVGAPSEATQPAKPPAGPAAPTPRVKGSGGEAPAAQPREELPTGPQQEFAPAPPRLRTESPPSSATEKSLGGAPHAVPQAVPQAVPKAAPKAKAEPEPAAPQLEMRGIEAPPTHGVSPTVKGSNKAMRAKSRADEGVRLGAPAPAAPSSGTAAPSSGTAAPPSRTAAPPSVVETAVQQLTLRVAELTAARVQIGKAVEKAGGRITRQVPTARGSKLTVRIPAPRFQDLVSRLEGIGTLTGIPSAPPGGSGEIEVTILVEATR